MDELTSLHFEVTQQPGLDAVGENSLAASRFADALLRVDAAISRAVAEYGPTTPLLAHYLQIRLALLVERVRVSPGTEAAMSLRTTVQELARLLFQTNEVRVCSDQCSIPSHNYRFPSEAYDSLYAAASRRFEPFVANNLVREDSHDGLFDRFLYVLGPNGEWRYLRKSQPVAVSITARRDAGVFPFHPLLARDFGFEVSLAGEISFAWLEGAQRPHTVYVNNVSGHYRPCHWASRELAAAIFRAIDLNAESSIIAIANDGAAISGRLGALLAESL